MVSVGKNLNWVWLSSIGFLQLGLHGSGQTPQFERVARNHLHMCIADNSSRLVQNQPIITEGTGQPKTPYLHTTAAWKHFQGQHLNTPSKFSDNDGTFLCNETHSRTLSIVVAKSIADQHGRPLPVGFLHLPKAEVCCLA